MQYVRAEARAREFATLRLEVGHDDGLDTAGRQGRHSGQADGARPDDNRYLTGLEFGDADVILPDRKGIDDGDRVARGRSIDDPGRHLRYHKQLAEAALGLGMLTDDAQPAGAPVDQPNRH